MPTIVALLDSEERAERAVLSVRDINFKSSMDISSRTVYSGFPCSEPRVEKYSIVQGRGGWLLTVVTDIAFLPVAIETLVEGGGIIQ